MKEHERNFKFYLVKDREKNMPPENSIEQLINRENVQG